MDGSTVSVVMQATKAVSVRRYSRFFITMVLLLTLKSNSALKATNFLIINRKNAPRINLYYPKVLKPYPHLKYIPVHICSVKIPLIEIAKLEFYSPYFIACPYS